MVMRECYKRILLSGHSVEYKDISLCRINDYCPRPGVSKEYKYGWQVHADSSKLKGTIEHADENGYSGIHTDLDKAISQFMKIRRILYGQEVG